MTIFNIDTFDAEAFRANLTGVMSFARHWKDNHIMAWSVGQELGIAPSDIISFNGGRIELESRGSEDMTREQLLAIMDSVIIREGVEYRFKYLSVSAEEYRDYGDEENRARSVITIQYDKAA